MTSSAWHIHIDAQLISPDFEAFATRLGFYFQDFLHHEVSAEPHYEPTRHLTYHPKDATEFKTLFEKLRRYLIESPTAIQGYVEGEFIPLDQDIEEKPFDATVPLPCKIHLGDLPLGAFREDEIHISLLRDSSDPLLQQALKDMGLYAAYLPKDVGVATIFTVQGSRTNISALINPLTEYLTRAGGGVRCSIKEERIAEYWVSGRDIVMPPVIDRIEWL
jgi:hypothetical protein